METSNKEHLEVALEALRAYRGEELARLINLFRGLTPDQMNLPYSSAGYSCAECLAQAQAHENRCTDAIAHFLALKHSGND